jgi:hypothetical protein
MLAFGKPLQRFISKALSRKDRKESRPAMIQSPDDSMIQST